jgi:hypothetical protein
MKTNLIQILVLIFVLSLITNLHAQQILIGGQKGEIEIEAASNGTLYLFNKTTAVLSRFTNEGILKYSIGGSGSGDDRFDKPQSFHLSAGLTLLVCDTGNQRVLMYDRNLQKIGEINQQSSDKLLNWRPKYAIMNNVGQIWVFDEQEQRLIQFDENGYLRFEVLLNEEIDVNSIKKMIQTQNYLWLIDSNKHIAYRFSSLGKYELFLVLPKEVSHIKSINGLIVGFIKSTQEMIQLGETGKIVQKNKLVNVDSQLNEMSDWAILKKSVLLVTNESILQYPLE